MFRFNKVSCLISFTVYLLSLISFQTRYLGYINSGDLKPFYFTLDINSRWRRSKKEVKFCNDPMLESFRMFIYSLILNGWRKESFCSCNWYRVQPQNDWTMSNWTVLALVKGATPKRLLF